jgi:hypothetical protein
MPIKTFYPIRPIGSELLVYGRNSASAGFRFDGWGIMGFILWKAVWILSFLLEYWESATKTRLYHRLLA